MEATKRPWKRRGLLIEDADDCLVADARMIGDHPIRGKGNAHLSEPELEAHAALIVKAVNAHDALVAALKQLVDLGCRSMCEHCHGCDSKRDQTCEWLSASNVARAALRKAEGEEA